MSGLTSGTYNFNPAYSEVVLEAFERCGLRNNALTTEHLVSARRSINLVFSAWTNRGVNLWKVDLVSQMMSPGINVYPVDTSVMDVLDVYLRQYQMGDPVNVGPVFSTRIGSNVVTVQQPASSNVAGNYVNIQTPVSVGGTVLQGFYQVYSLPTPGSWSFLLPFAANATVTNGGQLPLFTTTAGVSTVAVNLPGHGLVAGQLFTIPIMTRVGGLSLMGPYTVALVTDADNFVIQTTQPAGTSASALLNGGMAQIASQALTSGYTQNADPVDILLFPLSRSDYAAIPDKHQQGRPTSFWFDRSPPRQTMSIWLSPDGNGPYELRYYVWRQIQDANPQGGQIADIPYQFQEALHAAVAAHLAMKFAPERAPALAAYAQQMWTEAADENREKVPFYVSPNMSGYFN